MKPVFFTFVLLFFVYNILLLLSRYKNEVKENIIETNKRQDIAYQFLPLSATKNTNFNGSDKRLDITERVLPLLVNNTTKFNGPPNAVEKKKDFAEYNIPLQVTNNTNFNGPIDADAFQDILHDYRQQIKLFMKNAEPNISETDRLLVSNSNTRSRTDNDLTNNEACETLVLKQQSQVVI